MSDKDSISKDSILESLELSSTSQNVEELEKNEITILPCLFCDFTADKDEQEILQHLYKEHRIIISDAKDIRNLNTYLNFWKKEFEGL